MTKIKKKDRGLFEYQERMETLKNQTIPLERLNRFINWENFRHMLNEALVPRDQKKPGGAAHYDYVFMFKILIIQRFYNLSDEQTEFRINDSLSLQRFLGITLSDKVPDHNKIWDYRERLKKTKVLEKIFRQFDEQLEKEGIVGKAGVIIDATFVETPKQRNSREENAKIKAGETPEEWKDNPHKLCHKDTEARWTTKNRQRYYGYKNHTKVDAQSKIVREFCVTSANVHDSKAVEKLINKTDKGKTIYADSAYVGPEIVKVLNAQEMKNQIHEKGYRGRPLTEEQKKENRKKSKTRCRIEHVYGYMENSMNGCGIRSIGRERAACQIGLMNIVYNLCRYATVRHMAMLRTK